MKHARIYYYLLRKNNPAHVHFTLYILLSGLSRASMRRFFHRKQQSRPGIPTANGGLPTSRSPAGSLPNIQGTVPTTGRVRAPALRSRSMSVLYGPESEGGRSKRFTRSLSFCDNPQAIGNTNTTKKLLTQSEEDEVFMLYTKKLYFMFAALCAVITGFVVYAYIYNTAGKGT